MIAPSLPPLVGREREQGILRTALTAALSGRGSLVLIGGEAGIGKTALAEAALAEAVERDVLVLVGRCYDLSETPPYGPWHEALAHAPRAEDLPGPPDLAAGAGAGSQSALFTRVRDFLAALAARHPLALLLDDLHWADPASLDLLRFLGRQLADHPILVLATYRADELTRRHPLYTLLPTLEREARAQRLALRRFDAAGVRALVAARTALPADDAARLVDWLLARAEGNAFFTTQLLRALEDQGVLAEAAGRALGDLAAVGLPDSLRQVLDARLDRLGEGARHLLALAAVVGQEVPLATWAAVAEIDEDALLDTVERAVEARLLAETPDGSAVRFAHALIREALYAGLLATRRRRIHRRVGEFLAVLPYPDPDAVADHFQRAGDSRAANWLVRAGERAQRAYAWLTAAARYEAALVLLEGEGRTASGERARLLIALAQLYRYAGQDRGIGYLLEAERLAAAAGDEVLAAAARFDQGHLRSMAGDIGTGLPLMLAAFPALDTLPQAARAALPAPVILGAAPEEPYHLGALLIQMSNAGRYGEVLDRSAALETDPGCGTARGLLARGVARAMVGEPEAAARDIAASVAINRAREQHAEVFISLASYAQYFVVLTYQTDQAEARQRLSDDVARVLPLIHAVFPHAAGTTGPRALQFLAGDWHAVDREGVVVWDAVTVGLLEHARGDHAAAWEQVRAWLPTGAETPPGSRSLAGALAMQRLASALALDAGDLPLARAWLAAHDRWLAWCGAVLGQAEAAFAWAAYHRAAGDLARARQHAEQALAHAAEPRQPLALLAAHRLLGELATAEGRYADAPAHLDAALALAGACAAPYERALTLLAIAELRAAGNKGDVQPLLDEARVILASLEARPALARADTFAARLASGSTSAAMLPAGLSAREAEVLRLVAGGLTNAQVAERLFLSTRTVDQHLRSIYGKIGVENRTAAARFATEHGLA